LLLAKPSLGYEIIISSSKPLLLRSVNSLVYQSHLYHIMLSSGKSDGSRQARSCRIDPCIVDKSFEFHPDEDKDISPAQQIRIYMGMLFFNLASTIHLSVDSLRYPEYALRVALELYEVGFDLLLQVDDEGLFSNDSNNNDWPADISLAILTNMAEIHWTLSEFAKAARLMELQQSLLEIVESNVRQSCYSEQELEAFAMNIHLMRTPSGAAVA